MEKVICGVLESHLHDMVPCALFDPKGKGRMKAVNSLIYDLFLIAGSPCEDKQRCRGRAYTAMLISTTGPAFQYRPGFDEAKETGLKYWQVPKWAISYAMNVQDLVQKAEEIGKEHGYDDGLCAGKSFVRQLASGESSLEDFENGDGRNERRLTAKKW